MLEDFVFFAAAQRDADRDADGKTAAHSLGDRLQQFAGHVLPVSFDLKSAVAADHQTEGLSELDVQKVNAWRALRQSSWAGAFYLCTTGKTTLSDPYRC